MSKVIQTVEELDAVLHWRGKHAQAIKERDAILLQVRAWSGEAKAQRATVNEVGAILGGIPEWGPIATKVGDLQQRLSAADERADILEGLLREARHNHGLMLMSDPPRDAWRHHRMNERIDAALKPAEGRKPSTCTWSHYQSSWFTECGKDWLFTDGGLPAENGMNFCHSCGKTLVVEGESDE